jgi:hypothetical protein
MKGCFLFFAVILLNFLFCGDSFGQKSKVLERMTPITLKHNNANQIFNIKSDVKDTSKYVSLPYKIITCGLFDPQLPGSLNYDFHSIDKIIYLNDLPYKRPNNYFPGK